jgi:threonine/homoserine/homoserine lactone efflux protein
MLGTHNLSAFLLSSFSLWITPGTDTMYILARSISQGRQAGLISVLGISSTPDQEPHREPSKPSSP